LRHAGKWGRDLDAERTNRFVGMYVNELTLDYGQSGRAALHAFFRRAAEAGLIPDTEPEFVA
jgi:1,4-dihydroxy-6-naphthoate synthase